MTLLNVKLEKSDTMKIWSDNWDIHIRRWNMLVMRSSMGFDSVILIRRIEDTTFILLILCQLWKRPFMIILITASLSSKLYYSTSHWEEVAFVLTWSRFDNCSTFWLPFLNLVWDMRKQFPDASLNPLLFPETSWVDDFLLFNECNTSITTSHKSRGRGSVHSQSSIQRNNLMLNCETLTLLLAHPTWDKRSTSKDTWDSPCWFWIFKVSSKIWVLKIDPIDNVELMNVRIQTSQEFVTSSCHVVTVWTSLFKDQRECQVYQFVSNTSISIQFENKHWTNFQPLPTLPF